MSAFERLLTLWGTVCDLRNASAVLEWDELVFMPPGGADARGEQLATLHRLAHERLIAPEMAVAITDAEEEPGTDDIQKAALRVARREHDRAQRVPPELVAAMSRAASAGYQAWIAARRAGDYGIFAPALGHLLDLARQRADAIGHDGQRYDALLGDHEPGMRTARVQAVLREVEAGIRPLLGKVTSRPRPKGRHDLGQPTSEAAQIEAGRVAITAFGFRWEDGRQDRSVHPFSTSFSPHDTRITTRLSHQDFGQGFFATLHEAGHALYEQGIPPAWSRGPLGQAASTGVHESQSRLWENQVGRSLAFWRYFLPLGRACLPEVFAGCGPEDVYQAVNAVRPSLIRVEADEVTYPLHIALRLELELALLSGDLPVADLPGAWNEGMQRKLGLRPPDDVHGVLQDVHWSGGNFGYFPSYALGNIIAAHWMEAARARLGDLDALIAAGDFAPLLGFLREEIHARGATCLPEDLVVEVTGGPLTAGPYLDSLRGKYEEMYGV